MVWEMSGSRRKRAFCRQCSEWNPAQASRLLRRTRLPERCVEVSFGMARARRDGGKSGTLTSTGTIPFAACKCSSEDDHLIAWRIISPATVPGTVFRLARCLACRDPHFDTVPMASALPPGLGPFLWATRHFVTQNLMADGGLGPTSET
jgi:hypothetical protein